MKRFTYYEYQVRRRLIQVDAENAEEAESIIKSGDESKFCFIDSNDWEDCGALNPEYIEEKYLDNSEDLDDDWDYDEYHG